MRTRGLPDASTLDFRVENEATRQALYRLAIAHFWLPDQTGPSWSDDEEPRPRYTPQDAELRIVFFAERWFAMFKPLDERGAPSVIDRLPLFRATFDPTFPYGVNFFAC